MRIHVVDRTSTRGIRIALHTPILTRRLSRNCRAGIQNPRCDRGIDGRRPCHSLGPVRAADAGEGDVVFEGDGLAREEVGLWGGRFRGELRSPASLIGLLSILRDGDVAARVCTKIWREGVVFLSKDLLDGLLDRA